MLPLDNPQWQEFEGGYHIKYDASVPLKKLEAAASSENIKEIIEELSDELYHQGDVGVASYLAVPHLIRIGIEKQIIDWRLLNLVASIEVQRHKSGIRIPEQYEQDYLVSLQSIGKLTSINAHPLWDRTYACCALAALAASKGHIDMAEVILEFEDQDLTEKFGEFLDEY